MYPKHLYAVHNKAPFLTPFLAFVYFVKAFLFLASQYYKLYITMIM
jgi:hypothetical protein